MVSAVIIVVTRLSSDRGNKQHWREDEHGRAEVVDKQEQTTICSVREFALWNPSPPPMPRRPKKRTANHGGNSAPSFDRSKGKMKPWNTIDDIPLDGEDECVFASSYL